MTLRRRLFAFVSVYPLKMLNRGRMQRESPNPRTSTGDVVVRVSGERHGGVFWGWPITVSSTIPVIQLYRQESLNLESRIKQPMWCSAAIKGCIMQDNYPTAGPIAQTPKSPPDGKTDGIPVGYGGRIGRVCTSYSVPSMVTLGS